MSSLLDLQMEIQRTNEAVARAERTLLQHPTLPSAQATLRSFVQLRDRLQEDFATAARASGHDVCRYKIETTDPNPSVLEIAEVIGKFQRLFTAVYDAITNLPKQIARAGAEAMGATRLGFGYTFPGSIGVAMTVDETQALIPSADLDNAMQGVFEIIRARHPDEILRLRDRFGLATVRIAREWASDNAKAGFGADVEWLRKDDVRRHVRVQTPEIIQLENAIDRASDQQSETMMGELVEVNFENQTFQLRLNLETVISGTYRDAITPDRPATVPHSYNAVLQVSRRILSQGTEDAVSYFLVRLDPAE
jgi:hypothetical protein